MENLSNIHQPCGPFPCRVQKEEEGEHAMKSRQMNQKGIARMLRISPATVSMALRGEGRISESLREKVLALTRKHRITIRERKAPSRAVVRSSAPPLRLGYCCVQRVGSTIHVGAFRGMVEQTFERPHEVVLYAVPLPYGADLPRAIEEVKAQVLSARLDGLLLDPLLQLVDAFDDVPLPKLMLGYYNFHPERLDAVVPDNLWAGMRLTEELLNQGHRRIACVRCAPNEWNSIEKFGGYRAALDGAGVALSTELVVDGDFTWMSGAQCAQNLLALAEPPTAVFLENDWMTGQFVQGLREAGAAGARALESWTLAHVVDSLRETGLPHEILRAESRTDAMGRLAARHLMDRIAGRAAGEAVTFKVTPVIRPAGAKFADRRQEFPEAKS
jgi:LacI family transcriptional regulator